jgi:hypothetical protein
MDRMGSGPSSTANSIEFHPVHPVILSFAWDLRLAGAVSQPNGYPLTEKLLTEKIFCQ